MYKSVFPTVFPRRTVMAGLYAKSNPFTVSGAVLTDSVQLNYQ